ncbi:MAG: hypothetical protein JWN73_1695 [Betaproteobacteria bacterium]|nr:hypothetical protein [Betaproteobacteria bacterium]
MKNIKAITAAVLLLTAAGAYAGTDDGNVQQTNQQTTSQAPAPAAAGASFGTRVIDSGIVSPNP